MFELTKNEIDTLSRSQIATLNNRRRSNIKYLPVAFTELGISMLNSVLNSNTAIATNRNIMRTFVMIRQYALNNAELNQSARLNDNDVKVNEIYQVLKKLLEHKKELEKPRTPIGFRTSSYPSSE